MVQGTEAYFVELDMKHFESGSIGMYCDCPAFHTYETCKHIAATLYAIKDKEAQGTNQPLPHKLNYRAANHFINTISAIKQGERSEEHTSELQSRFDLVCRLLLEKKKSQQNTILNQ